MTPKAEGSYFEPKHLEQTTLSYIHFIENAQAKPTHRAVQNITDGYMLSSRRRVYLLWNLRYNWELYLM